MPAERQPLPVKIDFSEAFTDNDYKSQAESNWEPPPHVFYGKRMPNGKSEKEPVYSYQEFPRMLYKPIDGMLRGKVVNDTATKEAMLNDGWGLGPGDFGVETCPSLENVTRVSAGSPSVAPAPTDESIAAQVPAFPVPASAHAPAVDVPKDSPVKKKRKEWTPEQKEAARQRTLAALAKKKGKA